MKELTVRVWDKENSEMIYNAEYTYDYRCHNLGCMAEYFGEVLNDENYIVMLYSGFRDMNLRRIYDGDIIDIRYAINHKPKLRQIIFQDGAFRVIDDFSKHTLEIYSWDKIPVVGNIYENPEMEFLQRMTIKA